MNDPDLRSSAVAFYVHDALCDLCVDERGSPMVDTVTLSVRLVAPPDGYAYCLQKGKGAKRERLDYVVSTGDDLVFELEIGVREGSTKGTTNLVGPFAQGTPDARFFYLCVGVCAETEEPRWSGRVKIPLSSIDWQLVGLVLNEPDALLEASYAATRPQGGPALATVPLLNGGWRIGRRPRSN